VGDVLFYLKFWAKLTHPTEKNAEFQSILARNASAVTHKGGSKMQSGRFGIKVDFFERKSATKFLCVKTFSGKVVRHSLAYLDVRKWLVGDVPF